MKSLPQIFSAIALILIMGLTLSCESGKSYSELLDEENKSVNRFLVDQWVEEDIPADTVFQTGSDAPYYRIDGEGNIYMQVLSDGGGRKGDFAADDDVIYFRFKRYNLSYYDGNLNDCPSQGNQDDLTQSPTSFRFNNYSIPSSSQWGSGIQLPLNYLPIGCDINLVVKSQFGLSSEISYVQPYLFRIRYYRGQI